MGQDGQRASSSSSRLRTPWVAAAISTAVVVLLSWAMLLGDAGDDPASETLTPLSPSGAEVAFAAGSVVLLFLVIWAVLWLMARSRPRVTRE